jgi:hypothetical protein
VSWQACTIATKQQFGSVYAAVTAWLSEGKIVDIKVRESSLSRLDAMNALQFHWYREIDTQTGKSTGSAHSYCKLRFGVPIARKIANFQRYYDAVLKPRTPEERLKFMGPPLNISVTSNFNTKQMHQYLNAIKEWAAKEGYTLTTSNDLYVKAMGD